MGSSIAKGREDAEALFKNNAFDIDLIIDLYNEGNTANVRKGALNPKSAPLVRNQL